MVETDTVRGPHQCHDSDFLTRAALWKGPPRGKDLPCEDRLPQVLVRDTSTMVPPVPLSPPGWSRGRPTRGQPLHPARLLDESRKDSCGGSWEHVESSSPAKGLSEVPAVEERVGSTFVRPALEDHGTRGTPVARLQEQPTLTCRRRRGSSPVLTPAPPPGPRRPHPRCGCPQETVGAPWQGASGAEGGGWRPGATPGGS